MTAKGRTAEGTTTPGGTLTALLAESVAAAPGSVAIVDAQPEIRRTTREQLWRRTVGLRDDLRARGVSRGDCIAVWLPNWSDTLIWQFAAAALGAHVIGLNTRYGSSDVAHVLDRARPVVVALAHDFLDLDLGATLRAALTEVDIDPPAVAVVAGPYGDPPPEDEIAAHDVGGGAWAPAGPTPGPLDLDALRDAPDDLAVAFTTSGSTGLPKLAAHLGSGLALHLREVAAAGGWDASSVTLVVYPVSGVFGFVSAMVAVTSGGIALMEPVFRPGPVLRHMSEIGVTHLASADDVNAKLMAAWHEHPVPLERWQRLLIGDFYGNSMRISSWAEQETGTATYGIYGSSELFALVSFWGERDPAPARWRGGGRPVSSRIEVRAVDPGSGDPVAAGEVGELWFRGYNVVDAYLGDDDGSVRARSFTEDGWFRSGDLGSVRSDGAFEFRCRMGDSMRLRGFLVEPAEIETRLSDHPDVARTKVVGIELDGETRAVAFVEPEPGREPDPRQLREWCAAELAAFKVPETVHLLPELPTTVGTNGSKVRADVLRELAGRLSRD